MTLLKLETGDCACSELERAMNHGDHVISCPASLYQAGIQRGHAEAAKEYTAQLAKIREIAHRYACAANKNGPGDPTSIAWDLVTTILTMPECLSKLLG